MKNIKVSMKLIIAFLVVIFFSIAVGMVGIIGMNSIQKADQAMYDTNYMPSIMAGDVSQQVVEQRTFVRNYVIYDATLDAELFASNEAGLLANEAEMEELLPQYEAMISNPLDQEVFDEFSDVYHNDWLPILNAVTEAGRNNDTEGAKAILNTAVQIAASLDELTTRMQQINLDDGLLAVQANARLFNTMTIVEVAVLVVAVIFALFMAFYLTSLIAKPLLPLAAFMKQAGTTGNITLSDEDMQVIGSYGKAKDEIGQTIAAAAQFVTRINEVSKALEVVSNGDLTVELTPLSDKDVLGLSLEKMTLSLNSMFTEVNTATSQVSTGANQVADGAQALAAGATEQAASIQQLSSSISEIAVRTKDNAAKASEASKLADVIKGNAEKGSRQMDEMMGAVKDINQSSQDISKVIKVIDDIAFQTNILALNAAVEAARAGQHGKGFAVVAEEVRNLAAKSAEAASDTESLIANSLNKAALGVRIADETNASLNEIVSGINQSSALVAEISSISDEQSLAISQINTGIDQVAQVVQQNSATAEESAAASEEMSSQSSVLQQLVAQFKIKGGAGISALPSGGGHKMLASKEGGDYQARGGSGYGKY